MNNPDQNLPVSEEGIVLNIKPRPSQSISVSIPNDTMHSLEKVAKHRDMSLDALIKFYLGQGLRQDLSKFFHERVMEKTAQVLYRHIQSEVEVSAILNEIRMESVP
jgi:hypothetical protein